MDEYRIISSDNHVVEPPDLWTTRIEPKFRDRGPRVEKDEDGHEFWYVDGLKSQSFASMASQPGVRFENPKDLKKYDEWENARLGAYIPEEAIKDMDIDGVDVGLIYPSVGQIMYFSVKDSLLMDAVCRVYNDWVAEFCSANPSRLKGICMINLDDVQTGVKELERCAKMGYVGAMVPNPPPIEYGRSYRSPEYEPFWAAAQDAGMVLGLHLGTPRMRIGGVWDYLLTSEGFTNLVSVNGDLLPRISLTDMIQSGVFERYPKLMAGSVEHELNWVPYFLQKLDYAYEQRSSGVHGYRYKNDMRPSNFFHRNCFCDFQEDPEGVKNREIIGVDNILWGSDYPHVESTWPRSRQIIDQTLADCTEEEKAKIVGGNAARIYRI